MEEVKQILLLLRRQILEELDQKKLAEQSTAEIGDDVDLANQERQIELQRLFNDREYKKLLQIQTALKKIESKEYGICEECEGQIGKKRLMAMPFTTLCIQCKSNEELHLPQNTSDGETNLNFDEF